MGLPLRNFDPALVTAVNEAKRFRTRDAANQHWVFDPADHLWEAARTDVEGKPARDAVGLAIKLEPKAGQNPVVIPATVGPMTCLPFRAADGSLLEQRLMIYLAWPDIVRLRHDQASEERFPIANARFVYGMTPSMNERLKVRLTAHFGAGQLEPLFAPGVTLKRTPENGSPLEQASELNNPMQLASWAEGNSAVWWRFPAGVARPNADLLAMQAGDALKLFAEAAFSTDGEPGLTWYRVNAGYMFRRLKEAAESDANYTYLSEAYTDLGVANGRQAAYTQLPASDAGGLIAPPEVATRADLVVVSGGSQESTVLQPVGVVPGALFSFITSDEVKVFSTGLAGRQLRVRCAQPTITKHKLDQVWRVLSSEDRLHRNFRETFRPNTLNEFQVTDLPYQLTFVQANSRPAALEERLASVIQYGVAGWHTGVVAGAGTERVFVLQEAPEYRPDHWTFKPKLDDAAAAAAIAAGADTPDHRHQLRRLYPLRSYLAADGDEDTDREFAITQDETDCVRQEYAFHLNWAQTGTGLYYYQGDHAHQAGDVPAGGHREGADGGGPVPRYTSLTIPPRAEFRALRANEYAPILEGARPRYASVTAAPAAWRNVYDANIVPQYQLYLEAVKRVIGGVAQAPGFVLPAVFTRFVTFLQGLPGADIATDPVRAFLATVPSLQTALAQVAAAANDRLQINSFWRPPEHNETVSELRNSPHQDMRGFDIQSSGGQSPLNLLALHHAGENILATTALLNQVLLEHRSRLFVYAGYDDRYATELVRKAGNNYRLVIVPGGSEEDLNAFWGASPLGEDEPVPRRGVPRVQLLDDFGKKFAKFMTDAGRAPDWPNPTVDRVYFFALSGSSHVHFTVA